MFCNVRHLPEHTCAFSAEQQFKIIFKRLQFREKPFLFQIQHNYENHSNKIDSEFSFSTRITYSSLHLYSPTNLLFELQSPCFNALRLIHGELNDQEAFEQMIQAAETAANAAPILDEDSASIEELVDDFGIGADDDHHFSIITGAFGSNSNEAQILNALCSFGKIQSSQMIMKAFTYVLINCEISTETANAFYQTLPGALKTEFKGQMFAANGHSSVYNGHDHGFGFGDFMVAHALESDVARNAAFNLYIELQRNGF